MTSYKLIAVFAIVIIGLYSVSAKHTLGELKKHLCTPEAKAKITDASIEKAAANCNVFKAMLGHVDACAGKKPTHPKERLALLCNPKIDHCMKEHLAKSKLTKEQAKAHVHCVRKHIAG